MHNFGKLLIRLVKEDSGQDLIEYALVAALIGLGAVASLRVIGSDVTSLFSQVASNLTSAV